MLDPATVVETVRSLFPWGSTLLQHMTSQSIPAVGIFGGILHGAVITPAGLAYVMLEEAERALPPTKVIDEFEATFREVASAFGVVSE